MLAESAGVNAAWPLLLTLAAALCALLLIVLIVLVVGLARRAASAPGVDDLLELQERIETGLQRHSDDLQDRSERDLQRHGQQIERDMRDELLRLATTLRSDLGNFQQMLLNQGGDIARTQGEQIDTFRTQLATTQQRTEEALRGVSHTLSEQLVALSQANERRLAALQEGNERKLDQMRATVDEKLTSTLDQRLGDSFKQVAERLEQVHRGLGEMQGLARDVGSLSRVLTSVKPRGLFGEVQLAGLLEQVFTPVQYGANVETVPGSGFRVEFAVRMPGRMHGHSAGGRQGALALGSEPSEGVWLPIDAKFPREDYERLLDAQERADPRGAEEAGKALERRLRDEARQIREKYLAAPYTTDFAILFVPTEGLYAEALRRPGLVEAMQREHRVAMAGPTTLLAMLSSLQMGFRTLALEERSAEVWQVLGAVKTEFGKFGDVLSRMKKKIDEAGSQIDAAAVRTRAMARQLKRVEALPEEQARDRLGLDEVAGAALPAPDSQSPAEPEDG